MGIDNILDYFFRDNEIRHNTLVCCSEDKASDLLKIDNEGMLMPAERITTLLEIAGVPSYKTASGELLEVGTRMENETTDIYLPLIKLKTSEKDQKVAYVAGSVAFRESNPVYKLDNKETAGFCYLNNYVSNYPISVEYDGANYLFSIKKMKTKYDIQLENGKIKINVTFDADTILEEVTSQIRDIDDKQMKYIADMSGKEICNMAKQVTEDVFFGHKSDIFQIGSRVKKSHPKYFNTLESWVDTIDRCEFSFSHEITLSIIG